MYGGPSFVFAGSLLKPITAFTQCRQRGVAHIGITVPRQLVKQFLRRVRRVRHNEAHGRVGVACQQIDDFAGISTADLFKVQQAIEASTEPLRYSDQSTPWVGAVVASVLDLDAATDRKRIKRVIETWLKSGALVKQDIMDETRRLRPCIQIGEWAK